MPEQSFNCSVVTPDNELFDEAVTYVSFPAWDGQVGVQHGRAPLLCKLGVGPMRLDFPNGKSQWFLVEGGFAQMVHNKLTILSDKAEPAEGLTAADADRDLTEAQSMQGVTEEEFTEKTNALQAAREKRRLAQAAGHR